MTRPELLEKVLAGWFAIVGEFRGPNAPNAMATATSEKCMRTHSRGGTITLGPSFLRSLRSLRSSSEF